MRNSLACVCDDRLEQCLILAQNSPCGRAVVQIRVVVQNAIQALRSLPYIEIKIELPGAWVEIERLQRYRAEMRGFRTQITELKQHLEQCWMPRGAVQR